MVAANARTEPPLQPPPPLIPLSVILPTHCPDRKRLARVLDALAGQTLAHDSWELIVVDNASDPPVEADLSRFPAGRLVREPVPGLSHARRAGLHASSGEILVFVDDDNVLAPDYLQSAVEVMRHYPRLGAAGGKSVPEFETPPPPWIADHHSLLALRDLGETALFAGWNREYPVFAPIGAGMVLRWNALETWLNQTEPLLADRTGNKLTSGGDNDMVLHVLQSGWQVAYEPRLHLTHLIPAGRLDPDYLARLNEAVQESWMRVLSLHGINPWPPLSSTGAALRRAKAWLVHQAWRSPLHRIRWRGACGHFQGRIA